MADEPERQRIDELLKELRALEQGDVKTAVAPAQAGDDVVAKTRAEAGKILGVDERTISRWANDPTFPGRSGDAGARNGHFPIKEIRQWCAVHGAGSADADSEEEGRRLRLRKLEIEVADRQVDLEVKRGSLVSVDDVRSRLVDVVGGMRSVIEELGDRLVIELRPRTVKGKKRVRKVGERVARHALEAISDLVVRVFSADGDSDSAIGGNAAPHAERGDQRAGGQTANDGPSAGA